MLPNAYLTSHSRMSGPWWVQFSRSVVSDSLRPHGLQHTRPPCPSLFQVLKDDTVKVLHSICQQIYKTQQWPQDWKRSVFIPIPKKNNVKECSNYHTIALISHASKVTLKILQARLQEWTKDFQMFKLDLENAEEPELKLPTSTGSQEKQENSRKISTSALLTMPKLWLCGWQQTVENSERDGNTRPPCCLPIGLYAGQEAALRTGCGTIDWFQIGKGVRKGRILSLCLFNLYAEYMMWNARLDEAQAGIKIAGRNISNLRYADNSTIMAEAKRN